MRVLLAGAGYVGTVVAQLLAEAGHVPVIVRRSPKDSGPFAVVRGNLLDPQLLDAHENPFDALVYSASPDESSEQAYQRAYVEGLQNTLAALRRRGDPIKRAILTTSTAVYAGKGGGWVDEDAPLASEGFRGPKMIQGEQLLAESPFSSCAFRLGGIYGPGRTGFLRRVRSGQTLLPNKPRYTNRIHRDDAARAIVHLLAQPTVAPVYNGVDSDPADLRDVIRFCCEAQGLPLPPTEPPSSKPHKRIRSERLQETGFTFTYPSYREGYRALLQPLDPG